MELLAVLTCSGPLFVFDSVSSDDEPPSLAPAQPATEATRQPSREALADGSYPIVLHRSVYVFGQLNDPTVGLRTIMDEPMVSRAQGWVKYAIV